MSITTIGRNYIIILPVMKQRPEGKGKEKKQKTRRKAIAKLFTYANAKKIYYFTNVIRAFAVVSSM